MTTTLSIPSSPIKERVSLPLATVVAKDHDEGLGREVEDDAIDDAELDKSQILPDKHDGGFKFSVDVVVVARNGGRR